MLGGLVPALMPWGRLLVRGNSLLLFPPLFWYSGVSCRRLTARGLLSLVEAGISDLPHLRVGWGCSIVWGYLAASGLGSWGRLAVRCLGSIVSEARGCLGSLTGGGER